jgi:hypothetical protein
MTRDYVSRTKRDILARFARSDRATLSGRERACALHPPGTAAWTVARARFFVDGGTGAVLHRWLHGRGSSWMVAQARFFVDGFAGATLVDWQGCP